MFCNPLLDILKLNKMLFLDFGILLQGHHYISVNLSQQAKGTIFWLFSCSLQLSFQKQIFDRLSFKGYFEDLLELISSSDLRGDGVGGPGIDFLLSSAILSKGGTRSDFREKLNTVFNELGIPELKFSHSVHKKPWTLLARMKDHNHLAQLVLGKLDEWNAKTCIDMIDLCLSRPLKNARAKDDLEKKKREIALHQKVIIIPQVRETPKIVRPLRHFRIKE